MWDFRIKRNTTNTFIPNTNLFVGKHLFQAMTREWQWLAVVLVPFFVVLLSYVLTLAFFPYTPAQQEALAALQQDHLEQLNITAAEKAHLSDVSNVMVVVKIIFIIVTLILLIVILYHRKNIPQLLYQGGIATIISTIIIVLTLLSGFSSSFTFFHMIFFPQGNWQFPAESALIQTFPLEFFQEIALAIFIQAFCWGILFIVVSRFLSDDHRRARD